MFDGHDERRVTASVPEGVPRRPVVRLPPDVWLVGRDEEQAQIASALEHHAPAQRASISVLHGSPGVGKTALAIHIAHSTTVRELFPDGQLYFNLQVAPYADPTLADLSTKTEETDTDDPFEASARQLLRDVLITIGARPEELQMDHRGLIDQLADRTEGRRFFLVIDNVMEERQVRDIVPVSRDCHVVFIARRRLGAHEIVPGSPGKYEFPLLIEGLGDDRAVELFRRHAGDQDIAPSEHAELLRLVRRCQGNPLAVRALGAARAARSSSETLGEFTAWFTRARRWSNRFGEANGLWASLKMCYDTLPETGRLLFQSLSVVPGTTFDSDVADALLPGHEREGAKHLRTLWDAQLIQPWRDNHYTMHALVREFSANLLDARPSHVRTTARRAIYDCYLSRAEAAARALHARLEPGEHARHVVWFNLERSNLIAAVLEAIHENGAEDLDFAWQVCLVLTDFFERRGAWEAWEQTHTVALAATGSEGNVVVRAQLTHRLGRLDGLMRRWPEAIDKYRDAMALFRRAGHDREVGATLRDLGDVYRHSRAWDPASNCLLAAHHILEGIRDDDAAAVELAKVKRSLGAVSRARGRYAEAEKYYVDALDILDRVGDEHLKAAVNLSLSDVYLDRNRWALAEELLTETIDAFRHFDDLHWLGLSLRSMGEAQRRKHEYEEALVVLQESDRLLQELGDESWRHGVKYEEGLVHLDRGQFDLAITCFNECVSFLHDHRDLLWEGRAHLSLGEALLGQSGGEMTAEAEAALDRAWPLLLEQNSHADLQKLRSLLQ